MPSSIAEALQDALSHASNDDTRGGGVGPKTNQSGHRRHPPPVLNRNNSGEK